MYMTAKVFKAQQRWGLAKAGQELENLSVQEDDSTLLLEKQTSEGLKLAYLQVLKSVCLPRVWSSALQPPSTAHFPIFTEDGCLGGLVVACKEPQSISPVLGRSARDWSQWQQFSWPAQLSIYSEGISRGGRWTTVLMFPWSSIPFQKGKEDACEKTPEYVWHMVWKWSESSSSILQCWWRCFPFPYSLRGAAAEKQICFLKDCRSHLENRSIDLRV